jgi:hypothetical protein
MEDSPLDYYPSWLITPHLLVFITASFNSANGAVKFVPVTISPMIVNLDLLIVGSTAVTHFVVGQDYLKHRSIHSDLQMSRLQ